MKEYVVAILSFFDNVNKLYKVQAENPGQAIKQALVLACGDHEDAITSQREWNETLPDDVEELEAELGYGEMSVAVMEI